MRTARRVSRALSQASAVIAIAACGGSSNGLGGPRSDPALVAWDSRTGDLCQSAARRIRALPPLPYGGFDATHPAPASLPAVGAFYARTSLPVFETLLGQFEAIAPPPAASAAAARVRRDLVTYVTVFRSQVRAAALSDPATFVGTVRTFNSLTPRLLADVGGLNVPRCSAIVQWG